MQKIILKQSDKKILSQYSENQKPNEACAILFGKNNEVLDIFLTENIEEYVFEGLTFNQLFSQDIPG